jgi:CBS domain-containing protein
MPPLVRDLMTIGVPICLDTDTCAQAAARLALAPVAVVLDADSRPCGWIMVSHLAKQPGDQTVGEVMDEDIPTIPPDIPAAAAAQLMRDRGVAYLFLMHSWPGEPRPSAYISAETIERHLLEGEHASTR